VIERATFDRMKERWGKYGSWAFWADATDSSVRSNVGDLTVLDPDAYPDLFGILHDDVVMIGLNISRPFDEALRNFHDSYTRAKDHKIRFAFKDTSFYGAWMTDIVKGVPMTDSKSLMRYLRENPAVVHRSVRDFLQELTDLGGPAPTGLAFGGDAYDLVRNNVPRDLRASHSADALQQLQLAGATTDEQSSKSSQCRIDVPAVTLGGIMVYRVASRTSYVAPSSSSGP
jgi:hypothetical protein